MALAEEEAVTHACEPVCHRGRGEAREPQPQPRACPGSTVQGLAEGVDELSQVPGEGFGSLPLGEMPRSL